MAHVFISYSHKDEEYAHKLANELKLWGIDAWIDDRIDYGTTWPRVIQENINACPAFVVIMSSNAYNSEWVQNEVSYAQGKRKAIFPILLEGEVWVSFAAKQYVDARNREMPPNSYFETIRRQLGVRKVRTQLEQGVQKTRKPLIDQQLADQVVDHIYKAIVNGPDAEWEIGLFKINYHRPGEKTPPWLMNYPESYYIGSEVINVDLLSQYDSGTYLDYKTNLDRIMRKKDLMKTTTPIYLDYIPDLVNLRKRLNLQPGISSEHKFSKTKVQEFAEQLIDVHKAHNIPIGEIKIKVIK